MWYDGHSYALTRSGADWAKSAPTDDVDMSLFLAVALLRAPTSVPQMIERLRAREAEAIASGEDLSRYEVHAQWHQPWRGIFGYLIDSVESQLGTAIDMDCVVVVRADMYKT